MPLKCIQSLLNNIYIYKCYSMNQFYDIDDNLMNVVVINGYFYYAHVSYLGPIILPIIFLKYKYNCFLYDNKNVYL